MPSGPKSCVYTKVEFILENEELKPLCDVYVSYDEKPGIQAIDTTADDLPPVPGEHPTISRDPEYKRHGTMSLFACKEELKQWIEQYLEEVNANPACSSNRITLTWKLKPVLSHSFLFGNANAEILYFDDRFDKLANPDQDIQDI
jgi:hypothetical protein